MGKLKQIDLTKRISKEGLKDIERIRRWSIAMLYVLMACLFTLGLFDLLGYLKYKDIALHVCTWCVSAFWFVSGLWYHVRAKSLLERAKKPVPVRTEIKERKVNIMPVFAVPKVGKVLFEISETEAIKNVKLFADDLDSHAVDLMLREYSIYPDLKLFLLNLRKEL